MGCPSRAFTAPIPKEQQVKEQHSAGDIGSESRKGYSLFKQGILPEREDPKNANGGSWFIRQYIPPHLLDRYWKNLVAGLVDQKIATLPVKKNARAPKHQRGAASKQTGKIIFNHINGIRIDDKTHPFSQRAM